MIRLALLLTSLFLLTWPLTASALDSCVVPSGAAYNIDEQGTCRRITNSHIPASAIMVPTKTAAEWDTGTTAFLNALPAGVTAAACPAGGGACSHANPPTGVTLESTSGSYTTTSTVSAASGDTIVYGVATDATNVGRAYVYVRSGSSWTLQATLAPADTPLRTGAAAPRFGSSVAIDGDVIVVGAPGWDSTAGSDTAGRDNGAIYIFTRTGTTWTQRARFDGQKKADESFGVGVTVGGDSLGGVTDDENGSFRARFFRRTGATTFGAASGWFDIGGSNSSFTMAASQETVLVCFNKCGDPDGACTYDNQGEIQAFFYNGSAWALQQKIRHSDPAKNDRFCAAMDIDGNTIAAAATKQSPVADGGAVYIFTRSGSTWTQRKKIQPADLAASDRFGSYLKLKGEVLAVMSYDDDGAADSGSVYIFTGSGTTWTQRHKFQSATPAATELFRPIGIDDGKLYTAEGTTTQQFRSYILNCGSGSPTSCAP